MIKLNQQNVGGNGIYYISLICSYHGQSSPLLHARLNVFVESSDLRTKINILLQTNFEDHIDV